MWLRNHAPLLELNIRHVSGRPLASTICNRCRRYASSAAYPENIAVLGGGVSGLASAYFVSKEFPNSKITIYESGKETGGWIKSRRVDVPGGNALFEYGPRTLRPGVNCLPTAQLVQDLGLVDNVIYAKRSSVGAKNRYLYYPDRLNRLPAAGEPPSFFHILQLWQSGILDGAPYTLLEPWRPRRPNRLSDESIGSFIARRADKRIANNVVSAVMHGIYAGDVWQLSARTLLANAWKLEGLYGSVWRGMIRLQQESPLPEQVGLYHPYDMDALKSMREDIQLEDKFTEQLGESAMFSFRNGLQEMVKALQRKLEENSQVQIILNSPVESYNMAKGAGQRVEVVTGSNPPTSKETFDLVVSTLRNPDLTDNVTVMTVNLFFPKTQLAPVQGFGYLIPRSVPFEQNPERALGVIFDSDAVTGQDTASGTKLTVMLGGHWWNGWEHYPDEEEGIELARSVIRRHLGITEEPAVSHVNLSKDCIPQYTVGYEDRLKDYAETIRDGFRGKVRVVGNQYNGVGVNDCIKGAWLMAKGLRGSGWKERATGLERALDEREWVSAPLRQSMARERKANVSF